MKGEGFFLKSTDVCVRARVREKVGEFSLKTPNDFSKVGRCYVFSSDSGERPGGATKETATEARNVHDVFSRRMEIGMFMPIVFCLSLCVHKKNPFRCASKGKSARKVRLIGLEPTRLTTPDPKSGASTNFATSAFLLQKYIMCHDRQRKGRTFFVQWCRIGIFANVSV